MFVVLLIISYILTLNYMVELDHADFHVNLMMNMGFSRRQSGVSSGKLVARIRSNPSRMLGEMDESTEGSTSSSAISRSRSNSSHQSITLTPLNFLLEEVNKPGPAEEPRVQQH